MSLSLKMAALHSFQFSTIQISVTFLFSFDFDRVWGRLHGLIRSCISDSVAFNIAVPFKKEYHPYGQAYGWDTVVHKHHF